MLNRRCSRLAVPNLQYVPIPSLHCSLHTRIYRLTSSCTGPRAYRLLVQSGAEGDLPDAEIVHHPGHLRSAGYRLLWHSAHQPRLTAALAAPGINLLCTLCHALCAGQLRQALGIMLHMLSACWVQREHKNSRDASHAYVYSPLQEPTAELVRDLGNLPGGCLSAKHTISQLCMRVLAIQLPCHSVRYSAGPHPT